MQKSITCLDEEQRTFCISYICSLYPVDPGSPPYHHESHVPSLQVLFFIFIEHQHLGLGLTQFYNTRQNILRMFLALSNLKKINISAQTTSELFFSSKYNISSVALLYVIILILTFINISS